MDLIRFEKFSKKCAGNLAASIDEILKTGSEQKVRSIGFITTDDFQGFYLTWDYSDNIEQYFNWEKALYPDYLYQPLVDLVDACKEIDFCCPSAEKWEFAKVLLIVLGENIRQIPDEVFYKNHYKREDLVFFAAMSDGDYVQEMLDASIKLLNA